MPLSWEDVLHSEPTAALHVFAWLVFSVMTI